MSASDSLTMGGRTRPNLSLIGQGLGISVGVGIVLNAIVHLVTNRGAAFVVPDRNDATLALKLGLGSVIATTVIWLVIAAVGLYLIERFRPGGFLLFQMLAVAVALLSLLPILGFDIPTDSKVGLACTHLGVAVAAVVGHTVARRSRR